MGGNSSALAGLSEEALDEYVQLTYLRKAEIVNILKKFVKLGPMEMNNNFHYRFHVSDVMNEFPVLKFNPFRGRLFHVFSSHHDERFSFEDMLDLCSVMSQDCPDKVKATWAFKMFDFDDDNQVGMADIVEAISRLTRDLDLGEENKERVAKVLLDELDLQNAGAMGPLEFQHAIAKMPEFSHSFYFKV